jgi:uncharacterized protein (DUF4415 family)
MSIVRKKPSNAPISKKELASLKARREADIDYSDIPELDEAWFRKAVIRTPETKTPVSLRLDRDIVAFFKKQGKGYQTRMNAVLRAYVEAHRSAKR